MFREKGQIHFNDSVLGFKDISMFEGEEQYPQSSDFLLLTMKLRTRRTIPEGRGSRIHVIPIVKLLQYFNPIEIGHGERSKFCCNSCSSSSSCASSSRSTLVISP